MPLTVWQLTKISTRLFTRVKFARTSVVYFQYFCPNAARCADHFVRCAADDDFICASNNILMSCTHSKIFVTYILALTLHNSEISTIFVINLIGTGTQSYFTIASNFMNSNFYERESI